MMKSLLNPEMMHTLFMKNSDAVAVIKNGRHLIANEAYLSLFGLSPQDNVEELKLTDLLKEDEREAFSRYLTAKIQGKYEGDMKTAGLRNDGTSFRMEISVSPMSGEGGNSDLYLIALRDNSSSCEIQEELERSRRSLGLIRKCHQLLLQEDNEQLFMNRISQVISETENYDLAWYSLRREDGDLCTGSYNRGVREIGSIRSLTISSQCLKQNKIILCDDIFHFDMDPEEAENIIIGGYRSLIALPIIINNQSAGTLNIYSVREKAFGPDRDNLENLAEEICYGINAMRLKDHQVQLEKQLLQAQKMETIGTLAGGIAHDFNNIMTPIMGYSEMILARMTPDNPLYKYNEHIFNGAVRARELVKQIMTYSHREDQKHQPVYLDRIIREALQLMSSLMPKTITIRKHLSSHCGKVMADPAQIHQVIANLCTNSFHAMEEKGGDLIVELKRVAVDLPAKKKNPQLDEGEYVQLSISDTGKGMDRITKNRIFEPFFTTKPVGKGTGLGLSVVHGIIKNHNGVITVESEPGLGTVFRIFFPLLSPEAEAGQIPHHSPDSNEKIILLLDDHRDITEVLKIILVNSGYNVESYNCSRKALNSFMANPDSYSLIITDMYMPEISGLDFIRETHRKSPGIPSVVITGFEEELSEKEKRNFNIRKVIRKPILRNSFLEAVNQSLGSSDG